MAYKTCMHENKKRIAQLRIAVTSKCNIEPPCEYCRPGGEGYYKNTNETMSHDEIKNMVSIAAQVGFGDVRITGGEPLIRADILEIVADIKKCEGIEYVGLVTNGLLLEHYATGLKQAGLDRVTVSVDSANEDSYRKIRHAEFKHVLRGLMKCYEVRLQTKIDAVIMKSNKHEIAGLMKLAEKTNSTLKLLSLMDSKGDPDFSRREYCDFTELRKAFDNIAIYKGYRKSPGDIGTPDLEYFMLNGLHILLFDFNLGGYYHNMCFPCINYPCQDAIRSLRVTHDGHLKICLIRNDNLVDILTPMRAGNIDKMKELVRNCYDVLINARYFPREWQSQFVQSQKGDNSRNNN